MFEGIASGIIVAVGEAFCIKLLGLMQSRKIKKELEVAAAQIFSVLKNTSIDCQEINDAINSVECKELIKNYYISMFECDFTNEYGLILTQYIEKKCSSVKKKDIKILFDCLDNLYKSSMANIFKNNKELKAALSYINISNKSIIRKILENNDAISDYIRSLDKSKIEIGDREIISYHASCFASFSKIKFTGISGVESRNPQKLSSLYVKNTFTYYRQDCNEFKNLDAGKITDINLEDIFDYSNRIVLIGPAGFGKTTTLNYLFCEYENLFSAKALKIKIDLKEHAGSICDNNIMVLTCLSQEIYKRIPKGRRCLEDVENMLASHLEKGSCLVIFDALDEIASQSHRNKVRDELDSFCNVYYLNRFIISSREVGYLKNKFDDSFLHVRINSFSNFQIQQYSKLWHKANKIAESFKSFWEKFEIEVEKSKCQNMIRNPIVLILALVVFDIEKNLPNRRVEFYKKCIDTFLCVREDRKSAFKMTDQLRSILGDDLVVPRIAYYKFEKSNSDCEYRFSRGELEKAILDALQVNDPTNWIYHVQQYAKYLIDRTELLGEVDDEVYDFAHKTFFEYFLAHYYAKVLPLQELKDLLRSWLGDANNDELARLIIEVVVEKNDSAQHHDVIVFIFELLNQSLANCRTCNALTILPSDLFKIVVSLYNNRMLQPKFYSRYYDSILKYSWGVNRYEIDISLNLDMKLLSAFFCEKIKDNEDNFYLYLNSIFFLDSQFCLSAIACLGEAGDKIYALARSCPRFSSVSNYKSMSIAEKNNVIEYFLTSRYDLLSKSPEIYLTVLNVISAGKRKRIDIERMVDAKFAVNSYFTVYTDPFFLTTILSRGVCSPIWFLVVSTSLIMCALNRVNYLLNYSISRNIRSIKLSSDRKQKTENFVATFFDVFSENNFFDFVKKLKSIYMYDERFYDHYFRLYELYNKNEFDVEREELVESLTKRSMKSLCCHAWEGH